MEILFTVSWCLILLGVVGCIINIIIAADYTKVRTHLYSSIPAFIGVAGYALYAILFFHLK